MNAGHVATLRALREAYAEVGSAHQPCEAKLAGLAAFEAAIAALSAEGGAVAWTYRKRGSLGRPEAGKVIARSVEELDGNIDLYPDTWERLQPLVYGNATAAAATGDGDDWFAQERAAASAYIDSLPKGTPIHSNRCERAWSELRDEEKQTWRDKVAAAQQEPGNG